MAELAVKDEGEVARPLKVLIPLIQKDFDAGEKAGMEYFKAAGEKLNEAREGHFESRSGDFFKWAQKNFGKGPIQLRAYMALAAVKSPKSFKSLNEFQRARGRRSDPIGPGSRINRPWTAPVDEIAARARDEQHREWIKERDAERQLALRLISIGYKVLAQELHPDKGGSREAMARLNRVRDRLKTNV